MLTEYVKIPGLLPEEGNALVALDKANLDKLGKRVQEAKDRLELRQTRLDELVPGTPVLAAVARGAVRSGTRGIVIDKAALAYPLPEQHVAVQWAYHALPVVYSVFHLSRDLHSQSKGCTFCRTGCQ